MKTLATNLFFFLFTIISFAQDLSEGLMVNDLNLYPMQDIAKPGYLETYTDPSFGTTIRRITDVGSGGVMKTLYSTIQCWNADESLLILYRQGYGHQLFDGMTYEFIRDLDDVYPNDIEQIFWDFNDPDIFYYPNNANADFIKYRISDQSKEVLVDLAAVSNCNYSVGMGNDIQMMSWDSDVLTFRCGNESAFAYRISTAALTTINVDDVAYTAPNAAPSGNRFYHGTKVYDSNGNLEFQLNESSTEHSCIGKLSDGRDAHFAVSFAEGPNGGCLGNIIAHDLESGNCIPVISEDQGYEYSQSGTHISAVAHKNTEGGWIAASMIGFDEDGQSLLDQELVIAKVEEGNIKVCRIGHHRSDEQEFDFWGEPHAVISPTGTRVLFSSDWSGSEDGESIDCYVVELPAFENMMTVSDVILADDHLTLNPNPTTGLFTIQGLTSAYNIDVLYSDGSLYQSYNSASDIEIDLSNLPSGLFFISIQSIVNNEVCMKKIIKY